MARIAEKPLEFCGMEIQSKTRAATNKKKTVSVHVCKWGNIISGFIVAGVGTRSGKTRPLLWCTTQTSLQGSRSTSHIGFHPQSPGFSSPASS